MASFQKAFDSNRLKKNKVIMKIHPAFGVLLIGLWYLIGSVISKNQR
jgi:hypothetical protein